MIVLGIHDGHNATAALMIDGEVVANVSEERFTYRKNEMGFPYQSIKFCLESSGANVNDVDHVAFSTKSLPIQYMRIGREFNFTIRDWLDEQEEYWKPLLFNGEVNTQYLDKVFTDKRFVSDNCYYDYSDVKNVLSLDENNFVLHKTRCEAMFKYFGIQEDKIKAYDHHTCHQYYAYFASPFREKPCLIFTADGGGDQANGTVSLAENDKITEVGRNNDTDLARIYRYITLILGMKIGEHEFKVMGLAPYTTEYEISKTDKVFKNVFKVNGGMIDYENRPQDLFFHFRDSLADCRFDGIAGGVQQMVEEVGAEWFSDAIEKYNIHRVVFSGGLSMNVKLNKVIAELEGVDEFYCAASGGDDSIALGACYLATEIDSVEKNNIIKIGDFRNAYKGPTISEEQVKEAVDDVSDCLIYKNISNKQIAEFLADGLVLGRMCGNMEFGSRALGNRSIIADPSNVDTVKHINEKIKFRDFWMPFAPSVLDSYADKYLLNPKSISGDHMTGSFDTTTEGQKALFAAMHPADKTVRAHIVKQELNPSYYSLIEEFAKITGVGALLNTSFNLHGLPIVAYPEHAIHVLKNSKLDGVLLNETLLLRKYNK